MEPKQKTSRPQVKVVRQSSPRLLWVAVILLVVVSTLALLLVGGVRKGLQSQTAEKRQEAGLLEDQNAVLEDKIEALGTPQSVQDIARDQLGLVDPSTVILEPAE